MNFILSKNQLMMLLTTAILLGNCKNNGVGVQDSGPFASNLMYKWQWVKTVTPSGEITPQTLGHGKSFSYGNDGGFGGDYLLIKEEGVAPTLLYEKDNFGESNRAEGTITAQFDNQYIKFFLIKNEENIYPELIATDLVGDYTKGFGPNRHYYKRAGAFEMP